MIRARMRSFAPAIVAIAGITVLTIAIGACAPEPAPTSTSSGDPSTAAPPTTSSQPASSQDPTPEPTAGDSADVTIITAEIVDGSLEVTGVVTGRSDAAATCELEAEKAGEVVTAESAVTPSGENSFCPLLSIPVDELSSGEWEIVLSYRSDAGVTGRSASTTVEVP